MASQCYIVGRIEDAFRYIDATDQVTASDGDEVPHGRAAWAGGGYLAMGQVERWSTGAATNLHAVVAIGPSPGLACHCTDRLVRVTQRWPPSRV